MRKLSKIVIMPAVVSLAAGLVVVRVLGQELKPRLKTGVSENKYIVSLDASLSEGKVFNQEKAESLISKSNPMFETSRGKNNWFKIPAWLAGTWQSNQTTFTLVRDEKTGKEDRSPVTSTGLGHSSNGIYADKANWSDLGITASFRLLGKSLSGDKATEYGLVMIMTPTLITEAECAYRFHAIRFLVDKSTGTIVHCDQWEQEQSIYPLSGGHMRIKALDRKYDWRGNLIETRESDTKFHKTEELLPIILIRRLPDGKPSCIRFLFSS